MTPEERAALVEAHEHRIRRTFAAASLRHGGGGAVLEAATGVTPLDELMLAEDLELDPESIDDEERARIRQEAVRALLGWLVGDGVHPAHVARRTFALLQVIAPDLLGGMNRSDVATLLGQTKAAHSARILALFEGILPAGGKGSEGRATYARAATGNTSGRDGATLRRVATAAKAEPKPKATRPKRRRRTKKGRASK